jgi:GTPase SAR1 family protein
MAVNHFRGCHGILLVYDVTDHKTFDNVRSWSAQIQSHADVDCNKILIGNKCDMQEKRVVSYEKGEALANELKIKFFETSALSNYNIEEAFMSIIRDVKQRLLDNADNSAKGKPTGKGGSTSGPVRLGGGGKPGNAGDKKCC